MSIITLAQQVNQCIHFGLSTDTKDSDALDGHTFIETDTVKFYIRINGMWTYIPLQTIPIRGIYISRDTNDPSVTLGYGMWNLLPGPPSINYWERLT